MFELEEEREKKKRKNKIDLLTENVSGYSKM